jgi:hypothetical protein
MYISNHIKMEMIQEEKNRIQRIKTGGMIEKTCLILV